MGYNGRILGLKLRETQIWNVYPPSGSGFKTNREKFFREDLCDLMMNWKDHSKYIFQAGDHNCTHRMEDSVNNPGQHLQPGLVAHLKINGLKDDFLEVHGIGAIEYSRVTNWSATRIDYIFSNSNACKSFEYRDAQMNFDHKIAVGEYELDLMSKNEKIPNERFFRSWVIPKHLENDDWFEKEAKSIFDQVFDQVRLEEELGGVDYSKYWVMVKKSIQKLAKKRDKDLKMKEEERVKILQIFYLVTMYKIEEGKDCMKELESIKKELDEIYKERSIKATSRMRSLLVDDHVYDINKLQKERKYENQKKITEIKIGEKVYRGSEDVVKAIQEKMEGELTEFSGLHRDDQATEEEKAFLDLIPEPVWTEEEIEALTGPTREEEITEILNFEVDLDSSPGEDGITFRFIKKFWKFRSYKYLYVKFLNYTRTIKDMGREKNVGIMVVKNKTVQSIDYDKKRKLTKVNKDSNMGHGKVWTNRIKNIILPRILPKVQFNCQNDLNIVDEVREIRSVNQFLLGDEDFGQGNGTILSIDFNNAYRSTSLRWFNLVMKKLQIPVEFIDWFWMMYENLGIMIVINKYKSDILQVKRGFMEGHPPSMAAFVTTMIPLMIGLENVISGITTQDDQVHKVKVFADDMKLFLKDLKEVKKCYEIIEGFENISGMKMHRDPARGKCQALPFGMHREYQDWPEWVTVRESIKVVGIIFCNKRENFEKLNSDLVSKNFYNALQQVLGMRGTIHQKVYVVNTFLFSKLWYVSQTVKLDKKILEKMLKKSLDFIYAGENERPVRAINFRDSKEGGLGLIEPVTKAKALLVKNMMKDFVKYECEIDDEYMKSNIYGYFQDFERIYYEGLSTSTVKEIYKFLMKNVLENNGSLIPSRNEKKTENVKWSVTWKNLKMLQGVTPEEKDFAWKVSQDMLPVGKRIHRNVEKRCLRKIRNEECQVIPDIYHVLMECESIKNTFKEIKGIVEGFLNRRLESKNLIFLDFSHRKRKRLKLTIWFVVKSLYLLYVKKFFNKDQLFGEMRRELDWNISMARVVGSLDDMEILKQKL